MSKALNLSSTERATARAQTQPYPPTLATVWTLPMVVQTLRHHACQSDFAKLCRLSQKFYHTGNAYLYGSATLLLYGKTDTRSIQAFYQTLIARTELAHCVRSLHCISQRPRKLSEDFEEESSLFNVLADLLRNLHGLEALHIVDWFPQSSEGVKRLNQSIKSLPSLRHLKFNLQVPEWPIPLTKLYAINTLILRSALALPSLSSLSTTLQEDSSSQTLALPASNSISTLSLSNLFIRMNTFRTVLAALPQITDLNLEFLRYIDSYDSHISRHLDCQELKTAMLSFAPTLKRLRVMTKFRSFQGGDICHGGGEDAPWGVLSTLNLKPYTMLRELELAPELLLGWQVESSTELSTCLPDQLQSLYLRFDYGAWYDSVWDFENLSEKLLPYIRYQSSLRSLTVEYFDFLADEITLLSSSIRTECGRTGVHFQLRLI